MQIPSIPSTRAPTHPGRFRDTVTGTPLTPIAQGVPFLPDIIDGARLIVLAAFGADLTALPGSWTWTDITTDVIQDTGSGLAVDIQNIGRGDQYTFAPTANMALTLKNPDRRYTAHDPLSVNWPYVRQNTPIWVRLKVADLYVTRFLGYVNAWKPAWDTTGNVSVVKLSASGKGRQLDITNPPLTSALRTAITAINPAEYVPMEDESGATQLVSALSGGNSLIVAGGSLNLAADNTEPGSAPLPTTNDDTFFYLDCDHAFGNQYQVDWYFKPKTIPAVASRMFAIYEGNGTMWYWEYWLGTASQAIKGYDRTGTLVTTTTIGIPSFVANGNWLHLRFMTKQDGPNIDYQLVEFPLVGGGTVIAGTIAGVVGDAQRAAYFPSTDFSGSSFGHLSFIDGFDVQFDAAQRGYSPENPRTRLTRLMAGRNIPFSSTGFYLARVQMGPQAVDTFMNITRETELTDSGFLYDGLSAGYTYQGLSQRYDQQSLLTFDGPAGEFTIFDPDDDDLNRANRVRVERRGGSNATYADTDGPLGTKAIGEYEGLLPMAVNPVDDSSLDNRARWEVHRGTVQGFRYSRIGFDLRRLTLDKMSRWLRILPGSTMTMIPPYTAQHPAGNISVIAEGWAEQLGPQLWTVTANLSPGSTYDVNKIGDSRLGRIGIGVGRTIGVDAPLGSVSLSLVTPPGGVLFTTSATYPSDFPLDLEIAGLQITVSDISGTSSPQTATVTGVTKNLHAGDAINTWKPGVIAL